MQKAIHLMKVWLYILTCVCVIMPVMSGCVNAAGFPEIKPGYFHADYEGMTDKGAAFLACGADGRLDRIFEDGTVENIPLPVGDMPLTKVLVSDDLTLVGGVFGALAYSRDGVEFKPSIGAGNEHILGLVQFNGQFYACTYSGKILSSADGIAWKVEKELSDKPLIAIAANSSYIMAITEDTNIFKSEDGVNWDTQNYNTVYYGLAEPQSFLNIINQDESMYILGHPYENNNAPSVMYSDDGGESWAHLTSLKLNNLPPEDFYPLTIYSVRLFGDILLSACDKGRIQTFTDCPSCNEIMDIADVDLRCIAVSDNSILVAGDDFEFQILSAEDLQAFSASASQSDIMD